MIGLKISRLDSGLLLASPSGANVPEGLFRFQHEVRGERSNLGCPQVQAGIRLAAYLTRSYLSPRRDYKLNDVMGGVIVSFPVKCSEVGAGIELKMKRKPLRQAREVGGRGI